MDEPARRAARAARPGALSADLRDRTAAHSLIERLHHEFASGRIRVVDGTPVMDDEVVSWYQGALGERRVAQLLQHLGPEWTVLHSIPIGSKGRDIDHVVIGPPGAYALNTKYSPGRDLWTKGWGLYLGGVERNPYIQKLRNDVIDSETRLSAAVGFTVPTIGVLVFVDPGSVTIGPAPDGDHTLRVVLADDLVQWLRSSRRQLNDTQVDAIATAAARSGTWRTSAPPSMPGRTLDAEFEAFDAEFGTRMRARIADAHAGIAASGPRRPPRTSTRTRPSQRSSSSRGRKRSRATPAQQLFDALLRLAGGAVVLVLVYTLLVAWAKAA